MLGQDDDEEIGAEPGPEVEDDNAAGSTADGEPPTMLGREMRKRSADIASSSPQQRGFTS